MHHTRIRGLQPVNMVRIWNSGVGPIVDEFAEVFVGRSILSVQPVLVSDG